MLEGLTKDFDRRLREATVQERDTGGFHLGNQNVKTALALMRYDRLIKFLREKRDAKDQG